MIFSRSSSLAAGALLTGALLFAGQSPAGPPLEEVARLEHGPGNLTVSPDGRIFMSLHQFFEPELRVVELGEGGRVLPYPNRDWAAGAMQGMGLSSVLGIQSDADGVIWMLDNGMRDGSTPKLVGWDSRRERLHRLIHLPPPVTPKDAFVNDLAVDETRERVYIADPAGGSNAALIVVDLRSGLSRRVLEGHPSLVPEDVDLVIDGRAVVIRGADGELRRPRVGVNPIALDAKGEWLYYGPMHGKGLYRIPAAALAELGHAEEGLAAKVERYADKPLCDGISIDDAGNVYISDLEQNAIGVIGADRRYRILVSDPRLSWPDAFSFGPDGYLYTVANQLHRSAVLNGGESIAQPPFRLLRIRGIAPGRAGR